jgi:Cu/Ag efflux protein CusF
MKLLKTLTLGAAVLVASVSFASAETFAKGTIKKVDAKVGKVTIIHEELVNLEMPAMTMVFRADKDMIAKMTEGQNIEFIADRVEGKLTVIALK